MSTGKHRHTINGHENIVRSVVATSNKLISASDDKTIKVWDTDNFRCTKTINMNKIACELKIATGYLFAGSYKCVKVRTAKIDPKKIIVFLRDFFCNNNVRYPDLESRHVGARKRPRRSQSLGACSTRG
jgi:WD40 repeat protein